MCHSCSCVLLLPSWTSQKSSGMTYTHITPHAHIHTADTYTQHAHTQRHVSIPYTHTAHMYRHHTHAHHVSHIHIPHTAHTPTPRTYIPRTAHHTHARTRTSPSSALALTPSAAFCSLDLRCLSCHRNPQPFSVRVVPPFTISSVSVVTVGRGPAPGQQAVSMGGGSLPREKDGPAGQRSRPAHGAFACGTCCPNGIPQQPPPPQDRSQPGLHSSPSAFLPLRSGDGLDGPRLPTLPSSQLPRRSCTVPALELVGLAKALRHPQSSLLRAKPFDLVGAHFTETKAFC